MPSRDDYAKKYIKTIYKHARSKYYYVIFRHMPNRPLSTKQLTHEEALQWALIHANDKELDYKPSNSKMLLSQWAGPFFIEGQCPYMKRKSKRGYSFATDYATGNRGRLVNHILPFFGHYALSSITPQMVDKWTDSFKTVGKTRELANETKNKILITFKIVLSEAVLGGLIDANPLNEVGRFSDKQQERQPFTKDEVILLFPDDDKELQYIWGSRSWAIFFMIQAYCGLRPGEAAALTKQDIFLNLGGAHVYKSIDRQRNIKGLKTSKSGVKGRAILLNSQLRKQLDFLISELPDIQDFLFLVNGHLIRAETSAKHFKLSLGRTSVERQGRTPYCLRHTFDTLIAEKAPEAVLNELMGHTRKRKEYDHRDGEALIRSLKNRGIDKMVEEI